jgi:hypothetical protein
VTRVPIQPLSLKAGVLQMLGQQTGPRRAEVAQFLWSTKPGEDTIRYVLSGGVGALGGSVALSFAPGRMKFFDSVGQRVVGLGIGVGHGDIVSRYTQWA